MMKDLVMGNQPTADGQKVLDWLNTHLDKIDQMLESAGQDTTAINNQSGHVKDYWVNVRKARVITPAEWLQTRDYGARAILEQIAQEAQQEADRAKLDTTDQRTVDLEAKFTALEAKLTEALRERDEAVAKLTEAQPAATPDQPEPETPAATPGAEEKKPKK